MGTDLSLDDNSFNVTERAHAILDRYSQTHSRIGKNPETTPFKTMKDVYMIAVYIGSKFGHPRPLDSKRISPFKGAILNHDEQAFLYALAMGYTGDPDVISDSQRVTRIAEEFANAGVWELERILTTTDEGPLWDLADYFSKELVNEQ